MNVKGDRTLFGAPERMKVQSCVGLDRQVVHLVSQEHIVAGGVPVDVVFQLSLDTRIDKSRVPHRVGRSFKECRIQGAETQDPVADTSVQFRDDRLVGPRLEPYENPVLQLPHADRVE